MKTPTTPAQQDIAHVAQQIGCSEAAIPGFVDAVESALAAPALRFPTCCGMTPTTEVFDSPLSNKLVTLRCRNTLCENHNGVQAFEGSDIRRKWDKLRNAA